VAFNAGAALYAAGITRNLAAGVALAIQVISSGAAREKVQELANFKFG